MAEEQGYKSNYAGTIIDRAIEWVNQHIAVNLTKLKTDFDVEVQQRASAIRNVNNRINELAGVANAATTKAQEAEAAVSSVNNKFSRLKITRTVTTEGLYIGIKLDDTTIHTEKILPISFSGKPAAGKSMSFGIVDRDFVNELKAYIKRAVNGDLAEDEDPYRPKWERVAEDLKILDTKTDERIKQADADIKALEIYKDLFKGGQ